MNIASAKPKRTLHCRVATSYCLSSGGETKALAAVAANRNNPTFKNRRNSLTTKKKTFSNRYKNTVSPSAHLRLIPIVWDQSRAYVRRASEKISSRRWPLATSHYSCFPVPYYTPKGEIEHGD